MTTDRDQSIERLLRRARAPGPQEPDACPDAETLAALADDALAGAARREIERHVADCHRCQTLTASMVRADTAAHAVGSGAAMPWWRGSAVRWVVPAAAAATAVALWVAIPDRLAPTQNGEPVADSQVAALPPAAAPAEAPGASRPGASAAPAEAPVPSLPEASAPGALADTSADLSQLSREEADSRIAARRESAAAELERQRTAPPAAAESVGVAGAVVGGVGGGLDVLSPDPQRRWRIGPGDTVQHSVDGGATWTRQDTGAAAALTAGAAPTPDVCWLVGRGGLVLRTIDGGRQWQRIAFPEAVDLTSVAASSALAATLDTADGRRFRTADGGRTWAPVQRP